MANEALGKVLREMAFLLEMKGENPFKIRALENSARLLEDQEDDAADLLQSGALAKIPGVGKGTQALVKEFVASGAIQEHEALKAAYPSTIFELLEIPGLGPKKAKTLYEQLGISSLGELEYACRENRLVELKGFGAKTQANILAGIERVKAHRGKTIIAVAWQESEILLDEFRSWKETKAVERAGELRRKMEVLASLDFVIAGKVEKKLKELGLTEENGAYIGTTQNGLGIRVTVSAEEEFGSTLFEKTGPEDFIEKFGKIQASRDESELFTRAKKPELPPECRDLGRAPKDLIQENDIQGIFHFHTRWSDGANTLEEMVEAALNLGYEYLGVSEHSRSAFYAHGLDEDRVLEQKKEIERIQKKYPKVRIFHGIESDILADGSLDYSDKFLKNFDFVIASVHGQMRMGPAEMTKRISKALRHPATTWLGHWTGRLLLGRAGYEFDYKEILRTAAGEGKSIELNASPYRLDIDWRILPEAAKLNVPIGIFPDAHSTGGLGDTKYGVWMARKAGLRASDVINTKSAVEMEKWLRD